MIPLSERSEFFREVQNPIGYRLSRLRQSKGWTQEQLADAAGINARTIQRIEAGQPTSSETLLALAGALGVGITEFTQAHERMKAKLFESTILLRPIKTGDELEALIFASEAFIFEREAPRSAEERALIGEFLDYLSELGELRHVLSPSDRLACGVELSAYLQRLSTVGLEVMGNNTRTEHPLGERRIRFVSSVIVIRRILGEEQLQEIREYEARWKATQDEVGAHLRRQDGVPTSHHDEPKKSKAKKRGDPGKGE